MAQGSRHGVRFSASDSEAPPQGALVIRDAAEGDAAQIMDGFNATFETQRPPEYWNAKFNTAPPPASLIAIDEAGKVYAQFSGYPATLNNRGRNEPALFAGDVFARRAAEAIRDGIFLKVFRRFCIKHRAAGRFVGMVGFPNPRVLDLYQTTGYIAHASEVAEFALNIESVNDRTDRWPFSFRKLFGNRFEIRSFAEMDPEFFSAADSIAGTRAAWNDVVEFDRSAAWLDWRYRVLGRHYGVYHYHLVLVRGALAGWIITRRTTSRMFFVDWRFASRGNAAAGVLGRAFTEVLRQSGVGEAVALMSPHLRAEFADSLAWRQINTVPFAKVDFSSWNPDLPAISLNYGDTDLR